MKKRVLSIGQKIELPGIDNSNFFDASSFNDYDDIIIDPENTLYDIDLLNTGERALDKHEIPSRLALIEKRKKELKEFFQLGANLVIFLRPNRQVHQETWKRAGTVFTSTYPLAGRTLFNLYSWFPDDYIHSPHKKEEPRLRFPGDFNIINRKGGRFDKLSKSHPFAAYFQKLKEQIAYDAVIDNEWKHLKDCVIARDPAGNIMAMELPISQGRAILLPPNNCQDSRKVGGILLECLEAFERTPSSAPDIPWLDDFTLSGENQIEEQIGKIDDQISESGKKKRQLMSEKNDITKYKALLWGKDEHQLEPIVRDALRVIGLNIFQRDKYEEDYDIYGKEDDLFLVGEIGGSKGQIDVKKYRQLLAYCEQERVDKEHKVKGLLIGNGLCEQNPKERGEQFSPQTIRGCESQKFCYMTTYTLYEILERILANKTDEALKKQIMQKILETAGEFVLE